MADLSAYGRSEFTDPNGFARAQAFPGFDKKTADAATFSSAQITPYIGDALASWTSPDAGQTLPADEANDRYGVHGYLHFEHPVTQGEADFKSRAAARRQFDDKVMSNYQLSGLDSLWQNLKGGALDPVTIPTYFFGIGEARDAEALGQGALAIGRNRLIAESAARVAAENTAYGVGLDALDYDLKTAAGEDYDFGSAMDGLAINAAVGGGIGAIAGHVRANRLLAGRPEVQQAIETAAQRRGVNPDDLARMAELESRGNPAAQNPSSSASGLFQFVDKTWNKMGGGDKTDPALSADRAAAMMADNASGLRRSLGREPAGWELYLAHQQGLGGAETLLRDPEANAVDALAQMHENGKPIGEAAARERILKNGGRADMTAAEFAGLWRDRFTEGAPPAATAGAPVATPDPVGLLSPEERGGAYEAAVDAFLDNSPVDLGPLLPRDRTFGSTDTGDALPTAIPVRAYAPDVAVTTKGSEVPVRYAVADIKDLVTSHDNDLNVNPAYPADLQPRARDRAGAIANNKALESNLNPQRLLRDVAAESGAPIIGQDGVVESGNGRTIALRRSAEAGGETYGRYKDALAAAGYDMTGVEHPVLVRVNTADMSTGDRIRFTREANNDTVERMGASEQARLDAAKLPASALELLNGSDFTAPANRDFMSAFVRHVAPEHVNALTTADGTVSAEAVSRARAALMSKAYDNPWLVEKLFEDPDPDIKSIGKALQEAAPSWARLKALIDNGSVAAEADVSNDLNALIRLIAEAQERRQPLRKLIEDRLDQTDMLTGDALSEAQLVFLHTLYRNDAFTQVRAAGDIARAMEAYTRQAEGIGSMPDLMGNSPLMQAREALLNSADYAGIKVPLGDNRVFTLRPRENAVDQAPLFGGDARQPERPQPERGGGRAQDGAGGRGPAADAAEKPKADAQALIAADPELKALQLDTEEQEARAGLIPSDSEKPETLAEALRAIAFCLTEGGSL